MAEPRVGYLLVETEDTTVSALVTRLIVPDGSLQLAEAESAELLIPTSLEVDTLSAALEAYRDADVEALAEFANRGGGGTLAPSRRTGSPPILEATRSTVAQFGVDVEGAPNPAQNYPAFPSFCVLKDGTLLAIYFRGFGHNSIDGKIVLNRSSDGGKTWGTLADEQLLQDTASKVDTNPVITRLKSNRLFVVYATQNVIQASDLYCRYSDDEGATWSAAVYVTSPFTQRMASGGRVIELTNGTLLMPVYGVNTGGTRYISSLLQSTNGGTTWTVRSNIAIDANVNGLQYEEPQVGRLLDGRLMALVRVDSTAKIYVVYSSDDGLTWTAPVIAYDGTGWPAWTQLSTGLIIAFQRDPALNMRPKYVVSRDLGVTWSAGVELLPNGILHANGDPGGAIIYPQYMYGDVIEVSPNVAGVMFAYAADNSSTNAGIDYLTIADVGEKALAAPVYAKTLHASQAVGFFDVTPRRRVHGVQRITTVSTVDAEARNAHNQLAGVLEAYGLVPTSPMTYVQVLGWWDADDLFPPGTIGNNESLLGSTWEDRSEFGRDFVAMSGDTTITPLPERRRSSGELVDALGGLGSKEAVHINSPHAGGRLWVETPFAIAQPFGIAIVHTVGTVGGPEKYILDFRDSAGNGSWKLDGSNHFAANFGSGTVTSGADMVAALPVVDTLIVTGGTVKWRRNGVEIVSTAGAGSNGITALTYSSDRAKNASAAGPKMNTFAIVLFAYENDAQTLLLEEWLADAKGVGFDALLLEDGSWLLLEDGSTIILDQ